MSRLPDRSTVRFDRFGHTWTLMEHCPFPDSNQYVRAQRAAFGLKDGVDAEDGEVEELFDAPPEMVEEDAEGEDVSESK